MIVLPGRWRGGDLVALAYSPDGRSVAGGFDSKSILVWDLATGRRRLALKLDPPPIFFNGFAWSPDGASILAPSWLGAGQPAIQVYDAQTGKRGHAFPGTSRVSLEILDLMGPPPPQWEASRWLTRAEAIGWHLAGAKASVVLCQTPDHLGGPTLDGFPLAATTEVIVLRQGQPEEPLRDQRTMQGRLRHHRPDEGCSEGEYDHLGEHLLVPRTAHGTWLGTHVPGMTFSKCRFNHHPLAFAPDGRTLAVLGGGGIELRETQHWQPVRHLPTVYGAGNPKQSWTEVRSFVFSPDGQMLASGSDDGTVCLWSLAEPRDPQVFFWDIGPIVAVAFSPDGTTLAAGGKDQVVVWDVAEEFMA